ncbi:MAG: leucyl/phenylalanyl-tRNA--protein transferase [Ignavibacteriaceae bacterium]|nr:leucyl/phenylalanyl-tRNA--protein transferase [Ignavibacteriaceae bacterium]MCW9064903.1 leucyl/phenylalanyl-tRNA--protein transferase [Ignavibacteriaceae bacterium]
MDSKKSIDPKELLKPENMIRLYASGAFPMADAKTGGINWYLPEIRTIIPLDNFNIPRSSKKVIDDKNFELRFDTNFDGVLAGCADRESTWISDELKSAYKRLEKRGHIHTVETWKDGMLVGGLYGVTFRGGFFGESMFSKVSQASKAALVALLKHLKEKEFVFLDVQYMTEHLKMFGAIEISFEKYTKLLHKAYAKMCEF